MCLGLEIASVFLEWADYLRVVLLGKIEMGPNKQCRVCNQAVSKYKCPSCLSPYCSLICFKKHKEIPCSTPVASEQKQKSSKNFAPLHLIINGWIFMYYRAVDPQSLLQRPLNVDEPSEVVQRSQHQAIASSSEIRDVLKDEDLRKLIRAVDSSQDPENELDKAMELEEFRTLTDKILSTISPDIRRSSNDRALTEEELKRWDATFIRKLDEDSLHLVLQGANYLACAKLLDLVPSRMVEQVRLKFGIESDFTAEEEAATSRLHSWAHQFP
ncbi:hypothetical protein TIFTF001_019534 [Ficus carica]|uniref:HIT-type domain-containing protein n=1 Tax=Ficus carica TaxID=3494 RepID=A0AA88AQL7_FICCA|nr:hypothetical protein TIFTF001_019534 [Ficus carica]